MARCGAGLGCVNPHRTLRVRAWGLAGRPPRWPPRRRSGPTPLPPHAAGAGIPRAAPVPAGLPASAGRAFRATPVPARGPIRSSNRAASSPTTTTTTLPRGSRERARGRLAAPAGLSRAARPSHGPLPPDERRPPRRLAPGRPRCARGAPGRRWVRGVHGPGRFWKYGLDAGVTS